MITAIFLSMAFNMANLLYFQSKIEYHEEIFIEINRGARIEIETEKLIIDAFHELFRKQKQQDSINSKSDKLWQKEHGRKSLK